VSLGNATLQVASLPTVAPGTTFVLIQNDGVDAITGTFNGLAENAIVNVSGQPFRIHYAGGTGNDVTLVRDSGSAGPTLTGGSYTSGTFRLFSSGGSGVVYGLQASTDFIQWTNIGFATGSVSGTLDFADPEAFRYPFRFYRTAN
jgi:fibronectin-binding autotransporter adhesin